MTETLHGEMLAYPGEAGEVQAYLARPETDRPGPAVIVIHEIWGLTDHIRRVADRFMMEGYVAFAPNLYSQPGLADVLIEANIRETMQFMNSVQRDRLSDPAYAQAELAKLPAERREAIQRTLPLLIGGMPRGRFIQDLVKAVDFLRQQPFVDGKIGSIGFCFGGGMSINLACHTDYDGCVVFYGENPSPIEQVERITCPVLGIYGADDIRINSHLDELVRAMVTYKKDFQMKIYPGAAHAFFNETNQRGYRPEQSRDAWQRVLLFFDKALRAG